MAVIQADALKRFVADIFARIGCSQAEAARIALYLVNANLTGHDSHGVVRVPRYVQWKEEGSILPDQPIKIVSDTPVLAVIDGQYGFGQTCAPEATRIGIEKCKAMGLSAIALRNAGHIGRVGEWAEMAAAEGLVSVHFVNAAGSILVAPFGGTQRRFSTAPYSVGLPRKDAPPLILDFATSVVAEGKVLVASQGGKALPANALIDADGSISADPAVLYGPVPEGEVPNYKSGPGAIRAFGDHKGSGLAFMCEMLGGALTGTGATLEGRRFANGMLSFFIDPAVVDPDAFMPDEIDRYVAYVKSAQPAQAGVPVMVPGEPEIARRAEREAGGVTLSDETWGAICATARHVGLDDARIATATG
ncbi:MAG: malate/lactate/ureidoglycolate dehydrogenase [Pseudomonadota bacterium]